MSFLSCKQIILNWRKLEMSRLILFQINLGYVYAPNTTVRTGVMLRFVGDFTYVSFGWRINAKEIIVIMLTISIHTTIYYLWEWSLTEKALISKNVFGIITEAWDVKNKIRIMKYVCLVSWTDVQKVTVQEFMLKFLTNGRFRLAIHGQHFLATRPTTLKKCSVDQTMTRLSFLPWNATFGPILHFRNSIPFCLRVKYGLWILRPWYFSLNTALWTYADCQLPLILCWI